MERYQAPPAVELGAPTVTTTFMAPPDLPLYGFPLQQAASVAVLLSVLLVSVLLLRLCRSRSSNRGARNTPPSPPGLPIIGNLHQLGPLPHRSLRALSRNYGPLMLLQLGRIPTLVVSSAEMAEEVLKAHDLAFASRPPSRAAATLTPGNKGVAFAPYGEYWRQAKKVCVVHLLSAYRVQALRPARGEEVARLVGRISELSSSGAAVDMSQLLSSFTNSVICRAALGRSAVEAGTTGEVTALVAETLAALSGFEVENFFPSLAWLGKLIGTDAKLADLASRWRTILRRVVDAAGRRGDEAEELGFVDVLLSLQGDAGASAGGFAPSSDVIQAITQSMISAGTDTSYLVLVAALRELVKNPAAMAKAREEARRVVEVAHGKNPAARAVAEDDVSRMVYLKAVIKEALRLHPPAPLLLPRESTTAVRIHGYEIPARTRVVVNAWAIARDPDRWESPDEFRPERFLMSNSVDFRGNDFQFIPFGAGRRMCPGVHFATATMELALANLLFHFDWRLPEGTSAGDLDADEAPGLTTRGRRNLLLVAVKPN